jgi:hypothetical protein
LTLDAVYTMDGQVTQESGPSSSGASAASYSYVAHVTETLIPPAPSGRPVWVCDGTVSSHGTVQATFSAARNAGGAEQIAASFHDDTAVHEVARMAGGEQYAWKVDATVDFQGTLVGHDMLHNNPTGKRKWSAIEISSVIAETLAPLDTSGNPGPAWQIDESVATSGRNLLEHLQTSDDGQVVLQHGSLSETTRVEGTITPPATPGRPSPTPDVFTDFLRGPGGFHSIIIQGG